MKCPDHKIQLIKTKAQRIQNLGEHVSNPNGLPSLKACFKCPKCHAARQWTYNGEAFTSYIDFKDDNDRDQFYIDSKQFSKYSSALGTNALKWEVESERKNIYIPSWISLNLIQFFIEINYEANVNGEIIGKSHNLKFLKKRNGRFNILGSYPWDTWIFLYGRFERDYKRFKSSSNEMTKMRYLKQAFKPSYNRGWQYKSFEKTMKILFFNSYNKIK